MNFKKTLHGFQTIPLVVY